MLRNGLSFLKPFVIRFSVPGSGRSSGWPENCSPPPDFSPLRYDVHAVPGPSGSSLASRRGALPLTGSPDSPGAAGRSCWFRGLALSLLVAIAMLAFAAPAAAQTVTTFISNTGQTTRLLNRGSAVAFTTGTGTYTLSSVGIFILVSLFSPTPAVKIYGDTGGNPGTTLLATMTNPGTIQDNAVHTFTAPANTTLSASTTYWVVTSNSAATNGQGFRVGLTNNDPGQRHGTGMEPRQRAFQERHRRDLLDCQQFPPPLRDPGDRRDDHQQPADGGERDSGPDGDGRHGVQLCVPGRPRSPTRTPATP